MPLLLSFFSAGVCVAETGYLTVENNSRDVVKVVINWKDRKGMAVLTPRARSFLTAQKTTFETIDIYRIVNSAETLIGNYAAPADCDDVCYIDVTITESGVHIDCSRYATGHTVFLSTRSLGHTKEDVHNITDIVKRN